MSDSTPLETSPQPLVTEYLTVGDLRVAHRLLVEVFADDPEPIPPWDSAEPHKLETCRGCIEVGAFGVMKYPDLPSAVAKLFYSTIKLHTFPNGNKRFALVLSLMLLIKHGQMLIVPAGVGAEIAKEVAATDPHNPDTSPDRVIAQLARFYAANMGPYQEVIASWLK